MALCYFRGGYQPADYPTEAEWAARLTLERSRAIKCPSVADQLIGTKKMQQVLSQPAVLDKFIDDARVVANLRKLLTGLYSLDNGPDVDALVGHAVEQSERYVLKPQREGGGNNLYKSELRDALLQFSHEVRLWRLSGQAGLPLRWATHKE